MTPINLMAPDERERREAAMCYPLLQNELGNPPKISDAEQKEQVVCSLVVATFGYACRSSTGQKHLKSVYFYLMALAVLC